MVLNNGRKGNFQDLFLFNERVKAEAWIED